MGVDREWKFEEIIGNLIGILIPILDVVFATISPLFSIISGVSLSLCIRE